MSVFVIESLDGSARLELDELTRTDDGTADSATATIVDAGMTASARVTFNTYVDDAVSLANLLEEISVQWKGWQEPMTWTLIENPFKLEFTHDGVRKVRVKVTLGSGLYPDDWSVTTFLLLEPGSLESLAQRFQRFLQSR